MYLLQVNLFIGIVNEMLLPQSEVADNGPSIIPVWTYILTDKIVRNNLLLSCVIVWASFLQSLLFVFTVCLFFWLKFLFVPTLKINKHTIYTFIIHNNRIPTPNTTIFLKITLPLLGYTPLLRGSTTLNYWKNIFSLNW